MIKVKLTDGGRKKCGFPLERRDCTVRALALAAGISYTQAHEIAFRSGRKARRGWYTARILAQAMHDIGLDFYTMPCVKCGDMRPNLPTVQRVIAEHPVGRFVIETRTHAMALIDGVIHDQCPVRGRRRVEALYKISMP